MASSAPNPGDAGEKLPIILPCLMIPGPAIAAASLRVVWHLPAGVCRVFTHTGPAGWLRRGCEALGCPARVLPRYRSPYPVSWAGSTPLLPACLPPASYPRGKKEQTKLQPHGTRRNGTPRATAPGKSPPLRSGGEGQGAGEPSPRWTLSHSSGEGLVTHRGQPGVTPKPPGPLGTNPETRSLSNGIY